MHGNNERANALREIRDAFAAFGHDLKHLSDDELERAVFDLSWAVAHAGVSVEQAIRACQIMAGHLDSR